MAVCRSCGVEAAPDARFCHACGAAVADDAAREVRKVVTVLFADVVEFTQLGEELDPERLRRLMSRYFGEMRAVIERHGGTVEKFIGDEIMAVFGVPTVREDDALRAVRAAHEMLDRLRTLNDELERTWGARLEIRIGVNTGEVVAGDATAGHAFVTGDAVNVAKRLEQAAGAGQILLGRDTYPLVRHAIGAGPLESFKVKGKSEPVAPWLLDEVDTAAEAFARRHDVSLVGRARELAELRSRLDRVASERTCELVTVLGAPGIGKSRLVSELVGDRTDEVGFLRGRCLAYGDGITFWPLVEIVRSLGGRDALRAAVADAPEGDVVAERVLGVTGANGGGASSEETFWAIRRLLEELARPRPLVVGLDDVHWAEPTFLDLVEYLSGWIRDAPVLLVCMARPDILELRPSWATMPLIPLDPLPPHDAEQLLDALAGSREIDADVRRRITQAAEGNPLFVEQMLAMWEEEGEHVAVPPTIQALLAGRLDRLTREERAVLERASVAGKEFVLGGVVELSPPEERERTRAVLLTLVRKDFVGPARTAGGDAFAFRHALIRDATYDAMPKETRADLHERYAAWLERAAPERGELDEIIGYHLEQAYRFREQLGPVGERERRIGRRAAELLGAAGRRAFARDDNPAAVTLLDRALALATDEQPARLDLRRELSGAYWSVGEIARAESLLAGVIDAARTAGDRREEWYALLEQIGQRNVRDEDAIIDLLEVAVEATRVFDELDDDLGRARAWRRITMAHQAAGEWASGEDAAERAVAFARAAGDAREEARIVDLLCTSLLYGPAPADAAARRCVEILASAQANRLLRANVVTALAGLEAMRGRPAEARAHYREAHGIYADFGLNLAIAGLTQVTGGVELLLGDAVAAERELRRGYAILEPIGAVGLQAAMLAQAAYLQGRFDDAAEFLAVAETRGRSVAAEVAARGTRAKLAARDGDVEAAHASARSGIARAEATDALNLRADAWLDLAEVGRLTSDAVTAAEAAARAHDLYRLKANALGAERARALLEGVT